jgi:hypothetical protein
LACEPDAAIAGFVQEAYRHHKTIAVTDPAWADALGVVTDGSGVEREPAAFFDALALHRHWDRS